MRAFTYLLLSVAVASLGFGLWLLYARYVGGPEHYLGTPDHAPLRKAEASLADLRTKQAEFDTRLGEMRAKVETLPEGDRARTTLAAELDQLVQRGAKAGGSVAKHEALVDQLRQVHESEVADARARTARRGWWFTLIGVLASARVVESLRSRRRS